MHRKPVSAVKSPRPLLLNRDRRVDQSRDRAEQIDKMPLLSHGLILRNRAFEIGLSPSFREPFDRIT